MLAPCPEGLLPVAAGAAAAPGGVGGRAVVTLAGASAAGVGALSLACAADTGTTAGGGGPGTGVTLTGARVVLPLPSLATVRGCAVHELARTVRISSPNAQGIEFMRSIASKAFWGRGGFWDSGYEWFMSLRRLSMSPRISIGQTGSWEGGAPKGRRALARRPTEIKLN